MHGRSIRWSWSRGAGVLALTFLAAGITTGYARQSVPQQSTVPPTSIRTTSPPNEAVATLVFRDVTVIDVTDGRLHPEQTVVVTGTRVQAVGSAREVPVPKNARVVDARGKYLIPGLWDMHTHILDKPQLHYPRLVAYGVTGIRDAGTSVPLDMVHQWRREVAAGLRVGPRQIITGPSIPGFYKGKIPSTPAEGRRLVDSIKGAGADFIKVRTGSQRWSMDVYYAMADQARRIGIPFGGHLIRDWTKVAVRGKKLSPRLTPIEASDSGASIIDHYHTLKEKGLCMEDTTTVENCRPVMERLRRNGTWIVLTLNMSEMNRALHGLVPFAKDQRLFYIRDSLPVYLRHLRLMQQADIPLLAGTDAGGNGFVHPGPSLHDEMALLVWAGVTPLGALQAATLNPAKYLRGTDSLGTVAPGKVADLVLLDDNPLDDIRNTMKIRAVIANGRYFDRAVLDTLNAEGLERVRKFPLREPR